MACLVHLNLVGIKPDLVSNLEFPQWFAVSSHLFFASSKRCFDIRSGFLELIKALVNYENVAASTGGDGEVGLIAVYDFKW